MTQSDAGLPPMPKRDNVGAAYNRNVSGENMDDLIQLAIEPAAWVARTTLIVMEVVLGIDDLNFISILTNKF